MNKMKNVCNVYGNHVALHLEKSNDMNHINRRHKFTSVTEDTHSRNFVLYGTTSALSQMLH